MQQIMDPRRSLMALRALSPHAWANLMALSIVYCILVY